nr:uncharacterized protein c16c9.01c [Quercus suber]
MSEDPSHDERALDFVTLGMFIIGPPQLDIIGGAGTYSALGARILTPTTQSRSIGWIVDAGPDFPAPIRAILTSWNTTLRLRARDGPTTRGWNGYSGNEHRAFRYLTPKRRLHAGDLDATLLHSRSFHLICSAARCVEVCQEIRRRRRDESLGPDVPDPLFIWEPVPDLCTPAELPATLAALRFIDVLSPNHEELASYFSFSHPQSGVEKAAVEVHARHFLDQADAGDLTVVVRAGKEGCYVASRRAGAETVMAWLPAYHRDSAKVVDPTGGGNAFLGGLAVGLVRTGFDAVAAARWGTVAASFAIEQVGVPMLKEGDDGRERWNEEEVEERVRELERR